MLSATLYKFAKKENSTAQPGAGQSSLSVNVIINDANSSILSPSIRVPTNQTGIPSGTRIFDYNYAYIPDFARYYYVGNWVYNSDGTWTAMCSVDVLASWKTEIMASPGYVGRSQTHDDPHVQDRFYVSRNTPVTIRDNVSSGFSALPALGYFIIGAVTGSTNISGGTYGGVQYYVMTPPQFLSFAQHLLGIFPTDTAVAPATQLWKNFISSEFKNDKWESLNTPIQYIISCRFYPYILNVSGTPQQITLGGWGVGGQGGILLNRLFEELPWNSTDGYYTGEIPVSNVSQVGAYNNDDYPTYAPYASYLLQTPWGQFDLDPNIMSVILTRSSPKLYWKLMLNIVNGRGTFAVSDAAGTMVDLSARTTRHELLRTDVNVAVDIPLLEKMRDDKFDINIGKSLLGAMTGIIGSAGTFMSGNYAGGVAQGIGSTGDLAFGIWDACQGSQTSAQGNTAIDSKSTPIVTQLTLQQTRYSTVGRSPGMFGKPLKQYVSSLNHYYVNSVDQGAFSGFVQLDYSQFSANCTDIERTNVINFLKGGVLIE